MRDRAVEVARSAAQCFESGPDGLAPLLEQIGAARIVLIGEASHGTAEFCQLRADLTQALVEQKGFNIVAAEADWPDAYRANCWVRHAGTDADAPAALAEFSRFPRWRWRNAGVARFLRWLREHNGARAPHQQTGFYGLDLYSLHASIDALVRYLDQVNPPAAERARARYRCYDVVGEDAQSCTYGPSLGLSRACEDEVVAELCHQRWPADAEERDWRLALDDRFLAEQHARLTSHADRYYRAVLHGRTASWNVRDTHMMETLDALLSHVERHAGAARAVVWAHNAHLGDASATQMAQFGEISLGQLVRARHGDGARLIGLTTSTGTVMAASNWHEQGVCMHVPPALPASYEAVFHEVRLDRFVVNLRDVSVREALETPRLERGIGVVYRPQSERLSHYFTVQLPRQFDLICHIDRTEALVPLDRDPEVAAEGDTELAEISPPST